jgi:hypothetical protein
VSVVACHLAVAIVTYYNSCCVTVCRLGCRYQGFNNSRQQLNFINKRNVGHEIIFYVHAVHFYCFIFITVSTNAYIYVYIYIYITAIGLTPGGSSTAHIYTQTSHRIQRTEHT